MRIADIARLEGDPRIGEKVVFRSLENPFYVTADALRDRLTPEPAGIHGRGVWIIPWVENLTKNELLDELRNSIANIPEGGEFLRGHVVRISQSEDFPRPAPG